MTREEGKGGRRRPHGSSGGVMARVESTGVRAVGGTGWASRGLRAGAFAALAALACPGALALTEARAAKAPVEPAACQVVRLSDIGWTDVTATTALFGAFKRPLGYRAEITVLSLPVTYTSMKNKDIDVFLGNWMPSQEGDRRSYVADGSVQVIGSNLTGAKYT